MTTAMVFLLGMLCAYLAGSINFAILLFRLLGKDDPRTHFSGNAGVTNVYRQAGWPLAGLVLVLDIGRAMGVALLAGHFWADVLTPWAGLALILGNHFSFFHGWPCSKGVANYLGFYALLLPLGTGLALIVYLTIFTLTRISFLGSFGILATVTGFAWVRWGHEPLALAAVLITAISIVWFHRRNLAVLLQRKGAC
ncbi:MAG: glycerol-3-phosphate acyltransferase [Syntrophobacteraceae bacterium]|jgi:glycerol-3-phosphate acyltransferase PlsY